MNNSNRLRYDPKLKAAMEEIKIVLKKYDIGGCVGLVSPTHSEFLFEISPLWSCAHFENEKTVRFRAKEADYGSKEARNEAITLTVHLLLQIRDLGAHAFQFGEKLSEQLSQFMEIEHVPFFDFTPHKKEDK